MKLVVDENIPAVDELFGPHFSQIVRVNGRNLAPSDVADADALVVRSVSKVNESLLRDSTVRFVGTCTIGTDHIDAEYLESRGITWCSAPGCNADGVADYVVAALAHLNVTVNNVNALVIGCGNVGSRAMQRLNAIGAKVKGVDPYVQNCPFELVSLVEGLVEADIISLHTPLTSADEHATKALINTDNVAAIKANAVVINAGRGPVVTKEAVASRPDITWVLDVWDDEPGISAEQIAQASIATPHIAGYSNEGKLRGTWMVFNAWSEFAKQPNVEWDDLVGKPLKAPLRAADWRQKILAIYDIAADDQRLRTSLIGTPTENALSFDLLRKTYPGRSELSRYQWSE